MLSANAARLASHSSAAGRALAPRTARQDSERRRTALEVVAMVDVGRWGAAGLVGGDEWLRDCAVPAELL